MPRVVSVTARTVVVPLDVPTWSSTRRVTDRHSTLVRVTDDDGASSIGCCYAGSAGGALPTLAVRELLAPCSVGRSTALAGGLRQSMYDETLLHGRAGAVMPAISAVDIALWGRNARAAGLPLHALLGRCGTTPSRPTPAAATTSTAGGPSSWPTRCAATSPRASGR